MLDAKPDLFIGVDAPDFNLGLERRLRKARHHHGALREPLGLGLASGRGSRRIGRAVSHMLALFPFEPPIYERAGIPVTYVGPSRSPT